MRAVVYDAQLGQPGQPVWTRYTWSPPQGGTPNRFACESVLRHIWQGGGDANDVQRMAALATTLAPRISPGDDSVKQALKDSTARAIELGVFGVPTIEVEGHMFWGVDALPMLSAYLRDDPWFAGPAWSREGEPRPGVIR